MASTQLGTTDQASTITHGRNIVLASARLYAVWSDSTDLVYQYSDDDGVTWSSKTVISTGESLRASAFYDSVNGRLNFVYAGENTTSAALSMRAVTSNVTTGVPGALTTETVIDAGGANLGIVFPYAFHSATVTNPRYWIIAMKVTAAATYETRAWYATAGVSADTAGNWVTTNLTNLGANSNAVASHMGAGHYWTIAGADRVTLVFADGNVNASTVNTFEAVTFDPTAATPTPGTVTVITASQGADGIPDTFANGLLVSLAAKADYLVLGFLNGPTAGTWDFLKTVNGTTWTEPTGWNGLTMGRCQIALSGSDFYLVHTLSYGAISNSAQALRYRKITAASDNMGGVTAYSDTDGNGVAVPINTGTTKLYGFYRGSIANPYTVRADSISIGGGADTTPTGQASVSVTSVTSTTLVLSATMPADVDVDQYEVRYLTGATAPATNRTNGTISTAATATSANAVVTPSITGLTTSTRITGRVFVKDVAGNWNTGATFTAVPVSSPTFVNRYRLDGVTVVATATDPLADVLVWQLATGNFETGGANAHMRARVGTNAATPPTATAYDLVSTNGGATWQYENASSIWTNWPTAGLPSTEWARRIRLTNDTVQTSQFVSIRVEQ